MTNYKLVPVKQIREVIYVLEKFANDTFRGRNAAHELRELLSPAADGEEIMVSVGYDVYTLPLHPTGLTSGPRFVVHVPGPERLTADEERSGSNKRAERLAWALRLIESAKGRGFGIDYAQGVAQSALLRDRDYRDWRNHE